MSSKFAVSQSRAQNTPKVCKSKHPEASAVVIPQWQRAVVSIDIPANQNCSGTRILITDWLTRPSPAHAWSKIWTTTSGVQVHLTMTSEPIHSPFDIELFIDPTSTSPPFLPCVMRGQATVDAWSHTLYGEKIQLIQGANDPAGLLFLRFEGQHPTLV